MDHRTSSHGFTLIELAIVLVIIALLIGSVLVGQDLVKSAAINATIRQIEAFDEGATTFRIKYAALPGDITPNMATADGFTTNLSPSTGDRIVESYGTGNGTGGYFLGSYAYENIAFWVNLNEAGLVPGSFSGNPSVCPTVASLSGMMPGTKLHDGTQVHVGVLNNRNYYVLMHITALSGAAPPCGISAGPGLTIQESYAIDQKLDDGHAKTGTIVSTAFDANAGITAGDTDDGASPTAHPCAATDYNLTFAGVIACQLAIRTSF